MTIESSRKMTRKEELAFALGYYEGENKAYCWISVKDKLPETETEVFVRAVSPNGVSIYTTAMYEDGTMNTDDSLWGWSEDTDFNYDEESDVFLIPEGWWEYRHYNPDDVYNNPVDDIVTHWMPLPELVKED